jgi:hypothetical protein
MSTANNGKHKDNNNITNYLEPNKHNLLDLAEKNYGNLVEALATNAINAVGASSSDPKLSSMFASASNRDNVYRIEEQGSFHNSKGNIA